MTGTIITWVLAIIVFVAFGFGLRHVINNFRSGTPDCCKTGGCSYCPTEGECAEKDAVEDEKIIKNAEAKLKAEGKVEALHKLEAAEKAQEYKN